MRTSEFCAIVAAELVAVGDLSPFTIRTAGGEQFLQLFQGAGELIRPRSIIRDRLPWRGPPSPILMQRFPHNTSADIEDFRRSPWKAAIESAHATDCYEMWQCLSTAARTSLEAGKLPEAKVLWLLADACSMRLVPESTNEPLRPVIAEGHGRTAGPDDFTEADIKLLAEIAEEITEPALRARLADLAWLLLKPRNPKYALLAIDSYRALPLKADVWIRGGEAAWERAIVLCQLLKKLAEERLNQMEAALIAGFENATRDDGFLSLYLPRLLAEKHLAREKSQLFAEKLANMARLLDQEGNFERARLYFEASSGWFESAGDRDGAVTITVALAETWAKDAAARAAATVPSNAIAASFYEQAIQIYRTVPRKKREQHQVDDRLSELHRLMSAAGEKSLLEMGRVQTEAINISEYLERAKNAVSGKPMLEAFVAFVNIKMVSAEQRRKNAEQTLQSTPLRAMFAASHVHFDGRVVAKVGGVNFSEPDSEDHQSAVWSEMLTHYRSELQMTVHAVICPALEVLMLEHRLRAADLIALAAQSPIVPPGRALLFGKGLFFGYEGDFSSALHLLVPQIENMVRYHLKAAGAKTTNLDREGIENENGLSALIDLPEATQVFGADLIFELKALFCDPLAGNLRNELAHGLLDADASASMYSLYAWWLALKLVLKAFWNARSNERGQDASSQ